MVFQQVIPARIKDFDLFIAYVREALAKTTNEMVRKQADGWQIYRTVEAGPNGDALYVFVLNPAVPCVDYALAPILSEVYPDPAQLQEIWKLYQSSVRPSGSTLLTLVPAPVVPLTPPLTPPTTVTPSPDGAKPQPGGAKPQPGVPSSGAQSPPTPGAPPAGKTPPTTQKPAPASPR
jgi:hypothetical protein